jgi:hypothetical protein
MAPRKTTFLILAGLCWGGAADSSPVLGVKWKPSIKTEALDSGLAVGAFDGLLQTQLSPFAGWRWGPHQVTASVAIVRFSSSTEQSDWVRGNARLSLGFQEDLAISESGVRLWAGGSLFQLIPLLRDKNDSYSDTESAFSETQLSQQKAALAGTGIQADLGVEIPIRSDTWIGFHHHLINLLNFKSTEESEEINAFIHGETGIHVQVEF